MKKNPVFFQKFPHNSRNSRTVDTLVKLGDIRVDYEYYTSPPPIFLKLSGLKKNGMERCSSTKLAAEIHFYHNKKNVKIEQKII